MFVRYRYSDKPIKFLKRYAEITDVNTKALVRFEPTEDQTRLIESMHSGKNVLTVSDRLSGLTTVKQAYYAFLVIMRSNHTDIVILCRNQDAANETRSSFLRMLSSITRNMNLLSNHSCSHQTKERTCYLNTTLTFVSSTCVNLDMFISYNDVLLFDVEHLSTPKYLIKMYFRGKRIIVSSDASNNFGNSNNLLKSFERVNLRTIGSDDLIEIERSIGSQKMKTEYPVSSNVNARYENEA